MDYSNCRKGFRFAKLIIAKYKWIEVYIDIYGYYVKIIFNKTYFNKGSFSKENY